MNIDRTFAFCYCLLEWDDQTFYGLRYIALVLVLPISENRLLLRAIASDLVTARKRKLVNRCAYLFMGTHLRSTVRHLPYGITQCYLPPDTSERALH